jgi:hypothetical protein
MSPALRNHGFLRASTAGWSVSPPFDLTPILVRGQSEQMACAFEHDKVERGQGIGRPSRSDYVRPASASCPEPKALQINIF